MELTAPEVRVLGCLIEKQLATPDLYPMTVNALTSACNQSTARDPVVRYEEAVVTGALATLRDKGLTRIVYSTSNRAPKHRQVADEVLRLGPPERAVLCLLLLRGPQTPGELKSRSERLHGFADLDEVHSAVEALVERDEPLALVLPRRPGQHQARAAHLLAGPVLVDDDEADDGGGGWDEPRPSAARAARAGSPAEHEAVVALEGRVAALEAELVELRRVLTGELGISLPSSGSSPPS